MRCNWRRWLWGLIPILLLGWLAVWAERDRVEADLGERAKLALHEAGMEWAVARFQGRDAELRGTALDDADRQEAAEQLRSVWGVRVVDNNAALVPMAEKFVWRATRRGQRIKLSGHVPSKAVRKTIVGVTKANFPGFEVVDRMHTARGEPSTDIWLAGISFALKQLSGLKRGDVLLETLDLSVMGEAEDVEAYRAVHAAMKSLPKGVKLASNGVKAPTVSPYTFAAKREARQLVLTGHYPGESAKEELLRAARTSLRGAVVHDDLLPAEGAPQDWARAALASVQALGRLQSGAADMEDAALTVSGIADDKATAEAVRVALRAAMPPSIKLTERIRAKEPPPPPPVKRKPEPPPAPAPPPPAKAPEQAARVEAPPAPPPAPAKAPEPPKAARVETPPAPPPAAVKPPEPPKAARVETPPPPAPPPPPAKAPEPQQAARIETPPAPPPPPAKAPEPPKAARVETAPTPPPAPAKEPEPPKMARVETTPTPPPAPVKEPEPPKAARVETTPPPPPPPAKAPEPPRAARVETPPAPPPPTPAQLQAKACEESLASISHAEPILFGFDSARLDTASRPTLDKLAAAAKACPDMLIEIAGHASAEGTPTANHRLSLRRARSVAAYLRRAGVRASNLEAVGYGASQPKAPNDTEENKAKNRRIEFIVHPN